PHKTSRNRQRIRRSRRRSGSADTAAGHPIPWYPTWPILAYADKVPCGRRLPRRASNRRRRGRNPGGPERTALPEHYIGLELANRPHGGFDPERLFRAVANPPLL